MRKRKIKPGYIILFLAFLYVLYSYYKYSEEKKINSYKTEVLNIVTDIRRYDYFNFQKRLDSNLKDISLDNIKKFIDNFNLTKDLQVVIKKYKEDEDILKLNTIIKDNNKSYHLELFLIEKNDSYKIKDINFSNKILKKEKFAFPIILKIEKK